MMRYLISLLAVLMTLAASVSAQDEQDEDEPLRIEITEGVIEPLPYAVPAFVADSASGGELARSISEVIAADLNGTGLFREIPEAAHISRITSFSSPVQFSDWKAINAQALIVGAVSIDDVGKLVVRFRLYDVFAGQELGQGLQLVAPRRAGGGSRTRWPIRFTANLPARIRISTAEWFLSLRPVQRVRDKSAWLSWTTTAQT